MINLTYNIKIIYPDTCMTSKKWINKDFEKHIINIYKELF